MKNYNIIPLSIDKALDRYPIGTAGGYIRLLDAPSAANVKIHLNDSNADGIPLKPYHAIEASDIDKIYISCDAVPGETVTIVQAATANDFRMITPASDVKLSSLEAYESLALSQLDKIINPYIIQATTSDVCTTDDETTYLKKTLTSDKIKISSTISITGHTNHYMLVKFFLDGILIFHEYGHYDDNLRMSIKEVQKEFLNVKGKELEITMRDTTDTERVCYYLEEYVLKD